MTRFFTEKKAIFHHIPRTGGTWINRAVDCLNVPCNMFSWNKRPPWVSKKHTIPMHYYPSRFAMVRFQFAVVRHPVDYYGSVWRYLSQSENGRNWLQTHVSWHPLKFAAKHYREDFGDWVKGMCDNEPAFASRLYELFIGPEGGEVCAYIGRTETIQDDFVNVMNIIGYGRKVRKNIKAINNLGVVHNKRGQGAGEIILTDGIENMIRENEKLAIKRFYEGDNLSRRKYAELVEPVPKHAQKRLYGKGNKPPWNIDLNPFYGKDRKE